MVSREDASVLKYLEILQAVITRMATNSANCKAWCVALVTAIFLLSVNNNKPGYFIIGLFVIILFAYLDSSYLSLESQFRKRYDDFLAKLNQGTVDEKDLFIIKPLGTTGRITRDIWTSFKSWSIYPFYGILFIMVGFALLISI